MEGGFPRSIVDGDNGNLYPIYIYLKKLCVSF